MAVLLSVLSCMDSIHRYLHGHCRPVASLLFYRGDFGLDLVKNSKHIFGNKRAAYCVLTLVTAPGNTKTIRVPLQEIPEVEEGVKLFGRTWKVTDVAYLEGIPNITAKLSP